MKIFSEDGGGLFCYAHNYLLRLIGANPAKDFDVHAGCSGGSINRGLNVAGYTPTEICTFYEDNATRIFNKSFCRYHNPFIPMYDGVGLETVLKEVLGHRRLEEIEDNYLIIPVTRKDKVKLKVFENITRRDDIDKELWYMIKCSASAPVFFPPTDNYIDGGLLANNPSMLAVWNVVSEMNVPVEDISVFSMGLKSCCTTTNDISGRLSQAMYLLSNYLTGGNKEMFDYGCKQTNLKKYTRYDDLSVDKQYSMDDPDVLRHIREITVHKAVDFAKAYEDFLNG
jgi:patatin-like phospholipase/acyl hydrolase